MARRRAAGAMDYNARMARLPRSRLPATALILLACLLYLVSLIAHGRFQQADFRAYFHAAGQFVAGGPLYFVTSPDSPLLFRYAPPVAILFLPFRLLPVGPATLLWYALESLLVVGLYRLLARRLGRLTPGRALVFFLAIGFTLERELSVGNVNLLDLVAALAAFEILERGRLLAGSGLLALTVLAKPPNALLLVPLVARWPRLLLLVPASLLALLALPLPVYGLDGTRHLYGEFARSVLEFGARFGDTFKFHATTAGLLERLAGLAGWHPVQHPVSLLLGGLAALGVLVVARRRRFPEPLPFILGLALVPLSAMADYNVFVFVAPLVFWLLARQQEAGGTRGRDALLIAGLVLYGGNWTDLWGRRLSALYCDLGLHGVGTWLLIALALRPAYSMTRVVASNESTRQLAP
jgi:hypothetical protein